MVKVQELKGGQLLVTIPRQLARAKNIKKGMELEYVIDNLGNLLLRPKQA